MSLVKSDSGDEEDPSEVDIYYQWHGSYSKEEMGSEVAKVERYIDMNRERWGVDRVYSRYSEQGWARHELSLDKSDSSEGRRVGKECVSTGRSRWSPCK